LKNSKITKKKINIHGSINMILFQKYLNNIIDTIAQKDKKIYKKQRWISRDIPTYTYRNRFDKRIYLEQENQFKIEIAADNPHDLIYQIEFTSNISKIKTIMNYTRVHHEWTGE
jgi:hypothetical protein